MAAADAAEAEERRRGGLPGEEWTHFDGRKTRVRDSNSNKKKEKEEEDEKKKYKNKNIIKKLKK